MSNTYRDNIGNTYHKEQFNHLSFSDRVISIARSQIDFREIPRGSNWGKHVKKYLNSTGIDFPAAWCMAFVYWVYEQASKEMGIDNPLYKTAHVLTQWNKTPKELRSETPVRGSVFIKDYGGGRGHTGIVERVNGDIIHTIEGNTNDAGEREGYEVCRRTRRIDKCKGFINI